MTTASSLLTGLSNHDFVAEYAKHAPLALALERSLECEIYSGRRLQKPILDLGCGDGIFVEIAFGRGVKLDYGVDPNVDEVERAKKRGCYNQVFAAFGNQIPLPDASLTTIVSNSVLEHIPEIGPVLTEIHRLLRPDGELHITVPTLLFEQFSFVSWLLRSLGLNRLNRKYRAFYNRFWQHYNIHDAQGWKGLLEEHGFSVAEVIEYCSIKRAMTHDLLVPAALPAFFVNKVFNRYFVFPALRSVFIGMFRLIFPMSKFKPCAPGQGGLIYLRVKRK